MRRRIQEVISLFYFKIKCNIFLTNIKSSGKKVPLSFIQNFMHIFFILYFAIIPENTQQLIGKGKNTMKKLEHTKTVIFLAVEAIVGTKKKNFENKPLAQL